MISIPIGKMASTPTYWHNFIMAVHREYWDQYGRGLYTNKRFDRMTQCVRQIAINKLKPYGGSVAKFGRAEELRFDSEEDLTLFLLQWA